ncbi:MAG: hypothetical protein JNM27_18565 [Leptospirales bacterium]|nr:hypothetical protein [Leptospirales bacterium]
MSIQKVDTAARWFRPWETILLPYNRTVTDLEAWLKHNASAWRISFYPLWTGKPQWRRISDRIFSLRFLNFWTKGYSRMIIFGKPPGGPALLKVVLLPAPIPVIVCLFWLIFTVSSWFPSALSSEILEIRFLVSYLPFLLFSLLPSLCLFLAFKSDCRKFMRPFAAKLSQEFAQADLQGKTTRSREWQA